MELGGISEKDKTSMFADYRCFLGISSKTEGMETGRFDVTCTKGTSTITIVGKDGRIF
jgi:hypothetical protein